jgi:DNA-binding transcriptional LysR family regulator
MVLRPGCPRHRRRNDTSPRQQRRVEIRAGRLVPVELDHPTVLLHAYAVFARANRQLAKVRAMIDFLAVRWGPALR